MHTEGLLPEILTGQPVTGLDLPGMLERLFGNGLKGSMAKAAIAFSGMPSHSAAFQ